MTLKEDFLHFVWRFKRFNLDNLQTTTGQAIQIIHFGAYNENAGPDFFNAKIKIEETLWVGNVEMHLVASDWMKHQHQTDAAYNNVILHVVLEEDARVQQENGLYVPCLTLNDRIPPKLKNNYLKLLHNEQWIPCQSQFPLVSNFTKTMWLDRLLIERLEEKTAPIAEVLKLNKGNWETTFYQYLARNFGTKVNADAFEMLARATPLLTLAKHKDNLFQLEALLFGQASLLEADFEETYPNRLKKEYTFLQKKYGLIPIPRIAWRFLRMRPANFPTIRIAQFARLIHQSNRLFSQILENKTLVEVTTLFEVQLIDYWRTHYVFDKISKKRQKTIGKTTIQLLIINTIVPFLFLYGRQRQVPHFETRAMDFLEQLKPEKNSIIDNWKKLGEKPKSAYQTQALLQLKKHYCQPKHCLKCGIGNAILK